MKRDIVKIVSAKAGTDLLDTEKVLDAFLEYIVTEISCGRPVVLAGFGKFSYKEKKTRRAADGKPPVICPGVKFEIGIPFARAVRDSFEKRTSASAGHSDVVDHYMKEVYSVPAKKGRSSSRVIINLPKELRESKPDWKLEEEKTEAENSES